MKTQSIATLLFVAMSWAQTVAINIDDTQQEIDRRPSSLRGFKPDYIEKLYRHNHADSGYQHWHNDQNRDRSVVDYSLTQKELLDTAIQSKEAASAARELAEASVAMDYEAVKEATGELNSAAYLAKVEAELACALLPIEEEKFRIDMDKEDMLQNIAHVTGIANSIAQAATLTADAAERAVEAIQAPAPVAKVVSSAVFHTKSRADVVVNMFQQLISLMISNAGERID